jgi:predicted ATPase/DNA-binding SARP family transcriptional activator
MSSRGGAVIEVDVLGPVAVSHQGRTLAGSMLGGRRARVALVALALADGALPADRLADIVWAGRAPATWPAALRGVIGGLRSALTAIGAGGPAVIVTTPAGYGLAAGVEVGTRRLPQILRSAAELAGRGRHQAVLDALTPLEQLSGAGLLPGEDGTWLDPHRREIDDAVLTARELIAAAAGALGDHHRAASVARRAVAAAPLDERAHRALLRALHRAGDRAGVVLAYEQCRAQLAEQLGVDPDPETVQAYLVALGEQGAPAPARLPVASSAFFGRVAESAQLTAALGEPGLVTVAGRGGIGKSRLVAHVAAGAAPLLPGGRFWVPLASAGEDELVASVVAMTIGAAPGADDAVAQLAGQLAPLGRALLVLDGCEAVVDGAASLVSALLALCPMLSIVVTSRVPLAVEGERVVSLGPLPAPTGADPLALAGSLPVQLLADRVAVGGGRLDVDDAAAPFVAELCRRCGGLPLALELVAAQLPAMSLPDLLDHLPDAFGAGEDRLRAIARASYELLDPAEAQVFRLFGALAGPVPLPVVREVAADGPVAPVRVVRILRELTARGLLMVDRSGPRWRYETDDDLRAFARELLAEAGEETAALGRLADAVGALLPGDPRAAPVSYLDAVGELLPCVRRLLGAAVDGRLPRTRGLELGFRLHRYWAATDVTEGRFWLARLLADAPEAAWTARATWALGYLSYWSGDSGAAVSELQAAVEMLGQPDEYAARALIYLGGLADDLDRGAEALDFVARSISAAASFGPDLQVAAAIGMGCVLAERADPRAAAYARDAIELCRRSGSPEQLTATLPTAAMVCWQVGDLAGAQAYIDEAQLLLTGTRRIARVVLLSAVAGVALVTGDPAAAIEFGRAAAQDASDLGIDRELPLARALVAQAYLARADLPAAAREARAAVTAARSLSFTFPLALCLETAAQVILAMHPPSRPAPPPATGTASASGRGTASAASAATRAASASATTAASAAAASAGAASAGAGGVAGAAAPAAAGGVAGAASTPAASPAEVVAGQVTAGSAVTGGAAGESPEEGESMSPGDPSVPAALLAAAAAIRQRGDRPGMPTLRAAADAARAALASAAPGPPLDPASAAALALASLTPATPGAAPVPDAPPPGPASVSPPAVSPSHRTSPASP